MLMIERDYTDNSLHMYFKYSAKNTSNNNNHKKEPDHNGIRLLCFIYRFLYCFRPYTEHC